MSHVRTLSPKYRIALVLLLAAGGLAWAIAGFGGLAGYQWFTTQRASVATSGTATGAVAPNNDALAPSISLDGRFVVFESTATDLVSPATSSGRSNIYVRDLVGNTTTLVSHDVNDLTIEGN